MRLALTVSFAWFGLLYAGGAFYLYQQDGLARPPYSQPGMASPSLHHPEAALGVARMAMDDNNFSPPVLAFVEQSLEQLPSYYQSCFLLAAYHANRLERPERTEKAFEAALRRFPANGRLHLAYSGWLFQVRSIPPEKPMSRSEGSAPDPRALAERHLTTALGLEPDLTEQALVLLRRQGIPPERWSKLLPESVAVRRQLVLMLSDQGRTSEALALLRETLAGTTDTVFLRQGVRWSLIWGDPGLTLESALRWQELEEEAGEAGSRYHEAGLFAARAYLELGDTDAAYRIFRRTLQRMGLSSPTGLELLCSMAYEYFQRGQVVLAQSLFAEAQAVSPHYLPALLGLARTYRRVGGMEEAIEHYRKVLQLEPHHAEAERELEQLLLQKELGS